jgi:hypothetical protein
MVPVLQNVFTLFVAMMDSLLYPSAGVHISQGDPGDKTLYEVPNVLRSSVWNLLHVTLELSNFQVTARCLDSLWTPACYWQ